MEESELTPGPAPQPVEHPEGKKWPGPTSEPDTNKAWPGPTSEPDQQSDAADEGADE
jgi:hypothetical protein